MPDHPHLKTADSPTESRSSLYRVLTPQMKFQALLDRLTALETQHYQQTVLAEEAATVGNMEQAAGHLTVQEEIELRLQVVRQHIVDLGFNFKEN